MKKQKVKDQKQNSKNEDHIIQRSDYMVVGVDPSFNGFAIVVLDNKANIVEQKLISCKDKKLSDEEKIIYLENEFKFIPTIHCLDRVFLEGPSLNSTGNNSLQMGAINYYFRVFLYKNKVDYEVIVPGTLKKYVTGKGNTKKELILLNVYKKWGIEFNDNNLADAYGLARMALDKSTSLR